MKYAILLITYNRDQKIFSRVVQALANQTKKYDLFVKIDNCGDEQITNNLADCILQYFPNANITKRPVKYGLDLNVISAINEIFELGYDGLFYTEDDVVYDNNALEILENLMNWTNKNIGNIGIVQSWNYNLTKEPNLSSYKNCHGLDKLWYNCTYSEDEIGYTGQNYWGALMSKKFWDLCKPEIFNHYNSLINQKGFNFINFQNLISKVCYVNASDEVKHRIISRFNPTGWESIFDLTMLSNNLFKICLTNPRSKTIGEEGSTSTSTIFNYHRLPEIKTVQEVNSNNYIPTEFILNEESKKLWLK